MEGTLKNMQYTALEDKEWAEFKNKGATAQTWCERLFTGDVIKFKKYMGFEFMNDFKKVAEEEAEACKLLLSNFGQNYRNLKTSVEQQKEFIKRNTGEIKHSAEILQQAVDKFNKSVDDEKLAKITANIMTITDCLERLSKLENTGMLNKISEILGK